jgi:peroxiredoxin
MTSRPDRPLPEDWDIIPGARACTPQSCAVRDHFAELRILGVGHLFALSTQDGGGSRRPPPGCTCPSRFCRTRGRSSPQRSACRRLLRRLTLVAEGGVIRKVFYPAFPPDRSAAEVIGWL